MSSYPVTGVIALLALVASVAGWTGQLPVSALEMSNSAFHAQPWRLWTCTLYHVNLIHLAFDIYWFWVFGTLIEEAFGSARLVGLFLLFGGASAAAEFAFAAGGVGLSGVVYGFFGFLWVLSYRQARFSGAIDPKTIRLFVVWFFLCIGFTFAGFLPIGNVAHGSGLLLGAIIGYAVSARKAVGRAIAVGGVIALSATFVACASVLRPKVNFSRYGPGEDFQLGYQALMDGRDGKAVEHLRRAASYRRASAAAWFDLGIAYQRLNEYNQAADAYDQAAKLDPYSKEYRDTAAQMRSAISPGAGPTTSPS